MLSDLLHHARARRTVVRKLVHRPPWSLTYPDPSPLSVVAVLHGRASVRAGGTAPAWLGAGGIALIARAGEYTIAGSPSTAPLADLRRGTRRIVADEPAMTCQNLAPRTYGDGLPDATVMLRGSYELHGKAGCRLLDVLPALATVPAGPRTRPALEMLATEAAREEPGQDAILHRLLDLVLVLALRTWCAGPGQAAPSWHRALGDPAVGSALRFLHDDPARRWTVADLAAKAGMSRAAFAARFARLAGTTPLAYLTGWRMTLAADLLHDTDMTIAAVARAVGYQDAFAFSVAFKRIHGHSPSAWRHRDHAGVAL